MNGFEAYKLYLALKRHFTPGSTYDFVKYNGKTSGSVQAFESRKDKLFFLKLAKHRDLQSFLVANLSKNPKAWVGDLAYKPDAEAIYLAREKRLSSLSYIVAEETYKAADGKNPIELFPSINGTHPIILQAYIRGDVSLETMVVLDHISGMCSSWDHISWDPIVKQTIEAVKKIKPFTNFNDVEIRKALEKKFT